MSLELIYTSVPRGLSPGSSGFCTAAATGGVSRQVVSRLEALSGYQFHFGLSDPKAAENPVNYAHTQVRIGAETLSALSRVAFSGADYSGRTNKIAHHFLLEHGEQSPNGPAWMLLKMTQGVFVAGYEGEPRDLPKRDLRAVLPAVPRPTEPAADWQKATGDAGWAGMLVKAFRDNSKVPAFVAFEPGQDLLPLFEESLALLPPEERWQVGFATYYTSLPAGCQYHWRGVLAGSSAAREIQRFPNATVIDLTKAMGRAPDNEYAEAARTGQVLPPARAAERPRIQIVERAPEPVPVADEVAAEAGAFPLALDSERGAPAIDPRELAPSPAQLRALMRHARRARWVTPLLAAVFLLAISTVVSTALHFYNPWSPAEGVRRDLSALRSLGDAVTEMATDAKSQADAASKAAISARGALDSILAESSSGSLKQVREGTALVEKGAKEAREAAAKAAKAAEGAKEKAQALEQKANDLLARAGDDPKAKEGVEETRKRVKDAAEEAERSASEAKSHEGEAEKAAQQAKEHLDAATKQVQSLAGAPEVERELKPRDDPWPDARDKEPDRIPVWPASTEGNLRAFVLPGGKRLAFLRPPANMMPSITGFSTKTTANGTALVLAVRAGIISQKEFIECRVAERRALSCKISEDANMPTELIAIRDWFVVEVADLDARRVFQCPLGGRENRKLGESVAVGYDADGKPIRAKSVPFAYPWPKRLGVHIAGENMGPMQDAGITRDVPLPLQGQTIDAKVKVDIQSSGTTSLYVLTVSLEGLPMAMRAKVDQAKPKWSEAHARLDEIDKELAKLKEKHPGNEERKKAELQEERGERQKEITECEGPIQSLLRAAKEAFSREWKIVIKDAWGMPVVDLGIKFEGEAGAVIKASLEG